MQVIISDSLSLFFVIITRFISLINDDAKKKKKERYIIERFQICDCGIVRPGGPRIRPRKCIIEHRAQADYEKWPLGGKATTKRQNHLGARDPAKRDLINRGKPNPPASPLSLASTCNPFRKYTNKSLLLSLLIAVFQMYKFLYAKETFFIMCLIILKIMKLLNQPNILYVYL